jgi:hypothetical protein
MSKCKVILKSVALLGSLIMLFSCKNVHNEIVVFRLRIDMSQPLKDEMLSKLQKIGLREHTQNEFGYNVIMQNNSYLCPNGSSFITIYGSNEIRYKALLIQQEYLKHMEYRAQPHGSEFREL